MLVEWLTSWLTSWRLWLLALHLVFVLFWLAALFYVPRIFVYHAESVDDAQKALLTTMAARLLRVIANPAGLLALGFGLALLAASGWPVGVWMAVKLALLAGLFAFHLACFHWQKQLLAACAPSARFFRLINEVPPLTALVIILLAVLKPF